MISNLKAEFRKLFSVRSTYLIIGLTVLLNLIFAFYISGLRLNSAGAHDPNKLAMDITDAINAVAVLGALVGLLLVTHEYRYNTINYTLTLARNRSQVLVAKFLAISSFGLLFALGVSILSPSLSYLGLSIKGLHLVHQNFPVLSLIGRAMFVGWIWSMYSMILAFVIRSQVGAIVAVFMFQPVEALLTGLLKSKSVYLPFMAVNNLIMPGNQYTQSHISSIITVLIYVAVGSLVSWQLFLRRDAS